MIQDRVPAFSPSKAKSFIEKELGAPLYMLYKEFEDLPIAAASLGQVFALHFPLLSRFMSTLEVKRSSLVATNRVEGNFCSSSANT